MEKTGHLTGPANWRYPFCEVMIRPCSPISSFSPFWSLSAGRIVTLVWLELLAGSCASRGENDEGPAEARGAAPAEGIDAQSLSRPFALVPLATLPHDEIVRRILAYRMEAHTEWRISPPPRNGMDTEKTSLTEDVALEVDPTGAMHLLHDNDHGYGTEAVLTGGTLYMKMRYGPFIRRRPEPDVITRLEAAATGNSGALLDLFGPFTEVSQTTMVQVGGRPAIKLSLSRRAVPLPRRHPGDDAVPGRRWRAAAVVSSLSGTAVVDGQRGVLLGLRLVASFTAPRATASALDGAVAGEAQGLVRIDVNYHMSVGPGGDTHVQPPIESIEEPVRPRPMLDRQELLGGLVPAIGQRR